MVGAHCSVVSGQRSVLGVRWSVLGAGCSVLAGRWSMEAVAAEQKSVVGDGRWWYMVFDSGRWWWVRVGGQRGLNGRPLLRLLVNGRSRWIYFCYSVVHACLTVVRAQRAR